jgi:hypothetical protein
VREQESVKSECVRSRSDDALPACVSLVGRRRCGHCKSKSSCASSRGRARSHNYTWPTLQRLLPWPLPEPPPLPPFSLLPSLPPPPPLLSCPSTPPALACRPVFRVLMLVQARACA